MDTEDIFDIGGSSTGSEGMQKRQKGEGIAGNHEYMRRRRAAMT